MKTHTATLDKLPARESPPEFPPGTAIFPVLALRRRGRELSMPAQGAVVNALRDGAYYAARYRETARLREELAAGLEELGWEVLPGIANFLLCHLPGNGPTAAVVAAESRKRNLFVRDAALMGTQLGTHAIRIAVKDAGTNRRMLEILRSTCGRASRRFEPVRCVQRGDAARLEATLEVG